jgi:hypothetical protein
MDNFTNSNNDYFNNNHTIVAAIIAFLDWTLRKLYNAYSFSYCRHPNQIRAETDHTAPIANFELKQ